MMLHNLYFQNNSQVIFNILLPVHLAIFLAENQLDAPLLIDLFILILTVSSHGHQYGLTITEAVLIQFCLS
jgi:hypothetical protein